MNLLEEGQQAQGCGWGAEPLKPALPMPGLVLGVASSSHGTSAKAGFSGTLCPPPLSPWAQQIPPRPPGLLLGRWFSDRDSQPHPRITWELFQMQILF